MTLLPDCMMPDGGEACRAYSELTQQCGHLRNRIAMLEATMAAAPADAEIADIAESIVRCEATDFALATKSPTKSFDDQALSRTALKARIVKELAAQRLEGEISEAKVEAIAQATIRKFAASPLTSTPAFWERVVRTILEAAREA